MKYIYLISCPFTFNPIYIGQTNNLTKRKNKHLYIAKNNIYNTKLYCWIKKILNLQSLPIFEIIETCTHDDVDFWEQHYISLYRSFGFNLKNISLGGQLNKIMSNETKEKLRIINTGKKQSQETIKKRSETSKNTWKDKGLRELKSEQSKRLNELGLIGNKGIPSKKKGLPFAGDKNALSDSLKKYWSSKEIRLEEAIKKGSKPFFVYKVISSKKANRFRKETEVEIGELLYTFQNKNEASMILKVDRGHIRRCLKGELKFVKQYFFCFVNYKNIP